jgi:hypothetical protein
MRNCSVTILAASVLTIVLAGCGQLRRASAGAAEDTRLRQRVVGRWARADSDSITLHFSEHGACSGTGFLAANPAIGGEKQAKEKFEGRWEINDGRLCVTKPEMIIILRIRMPDENTIQLFDSPERIEQSYVYRRQEK